MLDDLLDMLPEDAEAQRWRPLLEFGPVAVVWPGWTDRYWIITTGKDQEKAFLAHDDSVGDNGENPVIISLPVMNSLRYGWSDRPFESVKEAAEDVIASNNQTEQGN